jgi:hypothetical protein
MALLDHPSVDDGALSALAASLTLRQRSVEMAPGVPRLLRCSETR